MKAVLVFLAVALFTDLGAAKCPKGRLCPEQMRTAPCPPGQSFETCRDNRGTKACAGPADEACAKRLVESEAYKAHLETTVPRRQFRAVDAIRDPDGLVAGHFSAYAAQASAADGPAEGWAAVREQDRATALAAPDGTALSFISHEKYKETKPEVRSCSEYVYKQFWDWSRYEDATLACKQDLACEFDVAFGRRPDGKQIDGAPRIAGRKLVDTAGDPLPPASHIWGLSPAGQFELMRGRYPKNPFFAIRLPPLGPRGSDPIPAILTDLDPKDLAELRALLDDGAAYYRIAEPLAQGDNERFADEWAWHDAMRQRTRPIEDAVTDELDERTRNVETLLAKIVMFAFDTTKVDFKGEGAVAHNPRVVLGDPVELVGSMRDVSVLASRYLAATRAYTGATVSTRSLAQPAPDSSGGAMDSLGMAEGWQADPARPKKDRFLCTTATTPIRATIITERGKSVGEVPGGMEVCQAWNLLLDEWDRLKRNRAKPGGCTSASECGCLEIGKGYGCDWSLGRFSERWVEKSHYIHERTKLWNHCKRFVNYAGKVTDDDQKNLGSYTKMLERGVETYRTWKKLPKVADDRPLSFGQDWNGGATTGDRDKFAARYGYDAGWELRPINITDDGLVCQMSASAWAGFNADVWLLGGHVPLVDTAAWIDANRYSAKHPNGSGKVDYAAYFDLFGMQLFLPLPKAAKAFSFAQSVLSELDGGSGPSASAELNQPVPGPKAASGASGANGKDNQWTLPHPPISFGFALGPIPVTVTAGASIHYGARFKSKTDGPKLCKGELDRFGAELTYTPFIGVGGFLDGGIGVDPLRVSVRGDLTLIDLSVPVTASLGLVPKKHGPNELDFGVGVDGVLSSLGGKLSLVFDLLLISEQITFFRWSGLGPYKFEIVPRIGQSFEVPAFRQYIIDACKNDELGKEPVCVKRLRQAERKR